MKTGKLNDRQIVKKWLVIETLFYEQSKIYSHIKDFY